MPSSVVHRIGDLPPDIRQAIVHLLGRPVESEEYISVTAYYPQLAPTGAQREEAARNLKVSMEKLANALADTPENELDELIDEAVDHARHHRP